MPPMMSDSARRCGRAMLLSLVGLAALLLAACGAPVGPAGSESTGQTGQDDPARPTATLFAPSLATPLSFLPQATPTSAEGTPSSPPEATRSGWDRGDATHYVAVASCPPLARRAIELQQLPQDQIASCTEEVQPVIGGTTGTVVSISYGAPHDCPSGCFYSRYSGVFPAGSDMLHDLNPAGSWGMPSMWADERLARLQRGGCGYEFEQDFRLGTQGGHYGWVMPFDEIVCVDIDVSGHLFFYYAQGEVVLDMSAFAMEEIVPTPRSPESTPPPLATDGRLVASCRQGLFVFTLDGQQVAQLTRDSKTLAVDDPVWSPDGRRVAFVMLHRAEPQTGGNNNYELWVVDADGANLTRLTNDPGWDYGPRWSADGRQIFFRRGPEERMFGVEERVFEMVINADGSGEQALGEAIEPSGVLSPDGTRVAFIKMFDPKGKGPQNIDIYVMDADGSNVRQLTDNPVHDDNPAWSPDGSQIVFVSQRDGNEEIYLMNADGSDQRRLTFNASEDWDPSWSPDGRWIVYMSGQDGPLELYLMDTEGRNQRRLGLPGCFRPAWTR